MNNPPDETLQRDLRALYPDTGYVPLSGLYLSHQLRALAAQRSSFVYSNFIASIDGRIAVRRPAMNKLGVPKATANPRDWRLFLELAAQADALIVSGRFIRELADGEAQSPPPFEGEKVPDLQAYRQGQGLDPHPALVVMSQSLALPERALCRGTGRRVIIATTADASPARRRVLEDAGAEIIEAGEIAVDGRRLQEALCGLGLRLIYSIAGPEVLHTLLAGDVLDRLYLTTVGRALGGTHYATLTQGARLEPPPDFRLTAMYLDPEGPGGAEQIMQVYDRAR